MTNTNRHSVVPNVLLCGGPVLTIDLARRRWPVRTSLRLALLGSVQTLSDSYRYSYTGTSSQLVRHDGVPHYDCSTADDFRIHAHMAMPKRLLKDRRNVHVANGGCRVNRGCGTPDSA